MMSIITFSATRFVWQAERLKLLKAREYRNNFLEKRGETLLFTLKSIKGGGRETLIFSSKKFLKSTMEQKCLTF